MRKAGKVTARKAAKILDINVNTMYRWCEAAVRGRPTKIRGVERTATGRLYVDLAEVHALKREAAGGGGSSRCVRA